MGGKLTTYAVLMMLKHNGELIPVGSTVDLDKKAAAPLIANGSIGQVGEPVDFIGLISELDGDDSALWMDSGAPTVAALSAAAGRAVSADERDDAWAAYSVE